MKTFFDITGNKVELCFNEEAFQEEARHVLVICQLGEGWVLTKHKIRGLEFPGGKMESGETLEETARREVYEETGAEISELRRMGAYRVTEANGSFVKTIFWGKVSRLKKKSDYLETDGPIIIRGDLLRKRFGKEYSFIMKDHVVEECIKRIRSIKSEKE